MRWFRGNMFNSSLTKNFRRSPIRRRPAGTLPRLESLEDRWVPTKITPTTFADGGPGSGSLRDAVLQLNADPSSDDGIIQLLAGTYTLTIPNFNNRQENAAQTGDLDITSTVHRLIIRGAGESTIIDARALRDRVFQIVIPTTQVVFQNLVITGALAQDDGSNDALAGATNARGGGILNNGGEVTLDNVVVTNNVAQGGNGATGPSGGPVAPASKPREGAYTHLAVPFTLQALPLQAIRSAVAAAAAVAMHP